MGCAQPFLMANRVNLFYIIHCLPPDEVRGVRVEASTGAGLAYYEAGVFHVRLEPLSSQTRFEALTLALHETNPGHHLQYTVAGQQQGLPDFIKRPLFHR